MSTIVGTNIEVTNIKFDSDTTSMIISNTGQITAQGEGTATTNLQQGLAKAWLTLAGEGSIAIIHSNNIATVTDNETGDYSFTYTNNMGTAKHPVTGSNIGASTDYFFSFITSDAVAQATTGDTIQIKHHSGVDQDCDPTHVVIHGDLA